MLNQYQNRETSFVVNCLMFYYPALLRYTKLIQRGLMQSSIVFLGKSRLSCINGGGKSEYESGAAFHKYPNGRIMKGQVCFLWFSKLGLAPLKLNGL